MPVTIIAYYSSLTLIYLIAFFWKSQIMRNAEGGRPLDEETDFCKPCKDYLIKKGWKLK
jgi:hypothetical protein